MLSALRGILQRWVGMTTEVQALEAGEAPAVSPAATPTCSAADYATTSAARRLKRPGIIQEKNYGGPPAVGIGCISAGRTRVLSRAGTLSNEAAELKRPRTAPTTPSDANASGANAPAGKVLRCVYALL